MNFWDDLNEWYRQEVGKFQQIPFIQAAFTGDLKRAPYTAFLKEYYHFVKTGASMYGTAGAKIPDEYPRVRDWLLKSAYKETRHDEFVLQDLEALGVSPADTRVSRPCPEMDALVGYNYYFIDHRSPLGVLGTAFLMGRLSAAYSLDAAEKIKQGLGLGEQGASFFFAHGHLDAEQPEDVALVIQSITDPKLQAHVLHNAKTVFMLYQNFFRSLAP